MHNKTDKPATPFAVIRFPFFILLMFFACTIFPSCAKSPQRQMSKAEKGVLDLSRWNFQKNGVVSLDGEWEFYWQHLLTPDDFARRNHFEKTGFIELPGAWNGYRIDGRKLGGMGFATFRLIVDTDSKERMIALNIPEMLTAYRLWINGKEVASNGAVGKSREESKAHWLPMAVSFQPEGDTAEVILQVSNFSFFEGGHKEKH